ncbi:hypothetical protein [Prosthecodimorpha staleyi]|uniref:Uncharacterized protein n=1 Tax=Prosthecodimorpha staleyi TaxID=2840188 RepID=A0A947D433_9HYPH|nr:hypothetical protein [Prosthecodimorpha staleyi]MBT9290431.1 hypothetical protein [Prosthecodimorpha staleyi]
MRRSLVFAILVTDICRAAIDRAPLHHGNFMSRRLASTLLALLLAIAPTAALAQSAPGRGPAPAGAAPPAGGAPAPVAPIPYAPNPAPAIPNPLAQPDLPRGKQVLRLRALVTDNGQPIRSGLVWRVFQDTKETDETKLKLVATAAGGEAMFRLDPGSYLVHAAYGRAGATTRVTVEKAERTETLVLNAGGMRLGAAVVGDLPVDQDRVTFDIYSKDADQRGDRQALVIGAKPGRVIRLNADTYHVVSHYGDLNAVVRAEIHVNPGKLTEATVYHKAAKTTLKLVAETGGEALAGVDWLVLSQPNGDQLTETVGAFPSFVLAEGEYAVVAKHQGQVYTRNFTVEAGYDREVELLADKLEKP